MSIEETAKTALESQKLSQAKLNPNEKPSWEKTPDTTLIKDEGSHTTDDKGVYFVQKWDKLKPLLDSFKNEDEGSIYETSIQIVS
jgi:hypothetical protein